MQKLQAYLDSIGAKTKHWRDIGASLHISEYTTVRSCCIQEDHHHAPDIEIYATEQEAEDAYIEQLSQWLNGRTHIVWRNPPFMATPPGGFSVHSTLNAYTPAEYEAQYGPMV